MKDIYKIFIKCRKRLSQLALKTEINRDKSKRYFVRTSLLVSVGVRFGMDECGIDSLGNRRPLEVNRDNGLASDVTVAYNPRSSQPSTLFK